MVHKLQPGAVRWLVILALAVRLAAAAVLVAGPWTNDQSELSGWDVARFQDLADEPGRPWVDHAVEYPPGSVVLIKAVAGPDTVATHRRLVMLSLAVDLGLALLVRRLGGDRAAAAYLLLGLPLVPMGLLRFDLWAALAALGAVALARRSPWARGPGWAGDSGAALLMTAAALIKVWPALVVAALWATGRVRAAALSLVAMGAAGLAWLAYCGWSLDPVQQVLSLRGATGWHLESVAGSLVALFGSAQPTLQLDAFRIGHLDGRIVLAGRVLTLAVVATLAVLARRATTSHRARHAAGDGPIRDLATVTLGSVGALIVTAPLLSPQFLLWLTPWAALQLATPSDRPDLRPDTWAWWLVALTGAATASTGLTLLAFGPPNLGRTVPALFLLGRDLGLAAVVTVTVVGLARRSGGAEDPLGQGGSRPHPAGAEPEVDQMPHIAGGLAG